ncbi:MAG: prepilin peptidase [Clostridia bacterium]|nr:prepilin peptidase [Clostridia bacterium]
MTIWPKIILYLYVFIVGLCIGSFVNVLIYRIPRGRNIAKGRSFCPACGHTLAARDLLPLFSFLFLKGRCRYCGARISPRYPLVELAGGLLAVVSPLALGWTLSALLAFLAGGVLLAVALIDADTQEIPDSLVLALAALSALSAVFTRDAALLSRVIGLFCVSLPMLLANLVRPTSFGGGDIKLCAAAGFLLGWQSMLAAAFIALLGGGGYGAWLLASRRKGRREHFAFGPFLAAGVYIALLAGGRLIGWYLGLFGI